MTLLGIKSYNPWMKAQEYLKGHASYDESLATKINGILHKVSLPPAKRAQEIYELLVKKAPEREPYEDKDTNQRAFGVAYQKAPDLGAMEHFVSHIRRNCILEIMDPDKNYYGLYTTVVQSSGHGKSRLVLESGLRHLNLVYACVRRNGSNGYPLQNKRVLNFLESYGGSVDHMEKFVVACWEAALAFYMEPEQGHSQRLEDGTLFLNQYKGSEFLFEEYWERVLEYWEAYREDEEWEAAAEHFVNVQWGLTAEDYGRRKDGAIVLNGLLYMSELVIVFDEAKTLLDGGENSAFRNLRRAQRKLGSKNVVLLFIDTMSTISNFTPASSMDSSQRPEETYKLLPPFYEIITPNTLTYKRPEQDTSEAGELAEAFSLGRPMWTAYYFADRQSVTHQTLSRAVGFAKQKLTFCREPKGPLDDMAVVAVFAVRFGITGVMDHSLATDLMSLYMGTGTYIDEDRIRMVVEYPPEPILGEAACQVLHLVPDGGLAFSERHLSKYILSFVEKCISGQVHAGRIGELLARIMLSLAYDRAHLAALKAGARQFFSQPMNLESFIQAFLGNYMARFSAAFACKEPPLEIPDAMRSGSVCFTSWMSLASMPPGSRSILKFVEECYKQRCAVIMPPSHCGADLLIPVQVCSGTGTWYTYILVQVKNRIGLHKKMFDYAGWKMTPAHVFGAAKRASPLEVEEYRAREDPPHYMALCLEVGSEDLEEAVQRIDKAKMGSLLCSYPNHLVVLGFDFISPRRILYEAFLCLRRREVEFVDLARRHRVLKILLSLRYFFSFQGCQCAVSGCNDNRCGCVKSREKCSFGCKCTSGCINSVAFEVERILRIGNE
jgi:hypothetical protein